VGEIDLEGAMLWSEPLDAIPERIVAHTDEAFVIVGSHVDTIFDRHAGFMMRFGAHGGLLDAVAIRGSEETHGDVRGAVVLDGGDVVVAGRTDCGGSERPLLARMRF
jgi:hypothetical protein